MIRFYKSEQVDNEKIMIEIACLSTDTKPEAGIATGSLAFEVNTGKIYAFDEAGSTWIELQ